MKRKSEKFWTLTDCNRSKSYEALWISCSWCIIRRSLGVSTFRRTQQRMQLLLAANAADELTDKASQSLTFGEFKHFMNS
jgi:hypothetical protein